MSKKKKRQKPSSDKASQHHRTTHDRAAKHSKKKRQPALIKRKHANWPVTALAGAGMTLTLYLALSVWFGYGPLYCADGSACDVVQQSRWGSFLALPTAFWGFLTYFALAYIGFKVRSPERHWKLAWVISLVGVSYSVYLTSVSHFIIGAFCPCCLVSLTIMTSIFGVVIAQRPEGMMNLKLTPWVAKTTVVALIIIGGMHQYYSGIFNPEVGTEDPYLKGLAAHLAQNDAILYGASW